MRDTALDAKVAIALSRLDEIQLELGEIRQWATALAEREKDKQNDD